MLLCGLSGSTIRCKAYFLKQLLTFYVYFIGEGGDWVNMYLLTNRFLEITRAIHRE